MIIKKCCLYQQKRKKMVKARKNSYLQILKKFLLTNPEKIIEKDLGKRGKSLCRKSFRNIGRWSQSLEARLSFHSAVQSTYTLLRFLCISIISFICSKNKLQVGSPSKQVQRMNDLSYAQKMGKKY